ncbi:hypothetical protein ACEPAF_9853 [Sanghuangporus sanghuang]
MRLGLSPSFRNVARGYATRRAVKPPPKIVDPLLSSPSAEVSDLPDGTTFIHRPPPTVPSPFSTTLLPSSPLLRPSVSTASSASQTTDQKEVPVPPRMHKERTFPTNRVLAEADFEKMRQLRASNPTYYTRIRLGKQFNCPPFLVAQKVPLDTKSRKAAIEQLDAKHEEIRSKWGERKSMIMAIRKKRREYW